MMETEMLVFNKYQIAEEMLALSRAYGSKKSAAKQMGISLQLFNDIIREDREITQKVADYFEYDRTVIFIRRQSL